MEQSCKNSSAVGGDCTAADCNSMAVTATDDFEALLSVPIEIIFREIMLTQTTDNGKRTNHRTFLFSKSEVMTLLRVSMLASELTTTMTMVYDALDRVRKGKYYRRVTEATAAHNVYLRALLPIIDIHSETSAAALNYVTCETLGISKILQELDDCAIELGKFSETNFNMADQLDWTMIGQSSLLSKEKRAIAEIEEAVVARITHLKEMTTWNNGDDKGDDNVVAEDATTSSNNVIHDLFIPMRNLCEKVFKKKDKTEFELNASSSSSEHSQSQINAAEAIASLSKEDG
jgi:hypothetical protein